MERSDLVQQSHVSGGLRRVHTQEPEAGQSATSSSWSAAGSCSWSLSWAPVVHRHQHHVAVQQLVRPVHGVGAQHEGAAVDEDDDGQGGGGAEAGGEHREVEAVLAAAGLLPAHGIVPATSRLHTLTGTEDIPQLARVQLTATTSGQRFVNSSDKIKE